MSKCNLSVTVDGWQAMGDVAPTFRVGQPITGTVHVWVNAPVRCNGLDVELVPVRTTQGYYLGLELPRTRLFEGEWEPGEYDYRFSIESPWLPSFQGRHLGWKWVARATADIPWAIDPKGESELVLAFAEPPTDVAITMPTEATVQRKSRLASLGNWALLLSLLMIAAGALGILLDVGDEELADNVAGAGMVMCIASLMLIGSKSRKQITSSCIDSVSVTHRRGGGDYRSGGGSFIDCEAKTRAQVASMHARLAVEEYAEWTTTKNEHTTTHRKHHLIHEQSVAMAHDAASDSWRGTLAVPEPGRVPCFSAGNPPGHGIVWKVELSTLLRGKNKPEVTRRYLHVRPMLG